MSACTESLAHVTATNSAVAPILSSTVRSALPCSRRALAAKSRPVLAARCRAVELCTHKEEATRRHDETF
jgi:hypothetical protein